ncbi:hypothetical protein RB195_001084 [Necator americanus]|uniref:Uncharacterized protein n=1 Tax=Necator americanus TaxID=51031 RepID=A0ABR1DCK3_NECAM
MDDRWVRSKLTPPTFLDETFSPCTVIYLSYVAPSALGLLQSSRVKFDTRDACRSASVESCVPGFLFREVGMSDASNSFSAWETLPEDEPPLCIAAPLPESPPRHYEAVNLCGGSGDDDQESDNYTHSDSWSDTCLT